MGIAVCIREKALILIFLTVSFLCPWSQVASTDKYLILFSLHLSSIIHPFPLCTFAVLDVYVLSTDGQVQDFKFPQSSKGGVSIQLSANTVKLNSRNGKLFLTYQKKKNGKLVLVAQSAIKWLFFVWEAMKYLNVFDFWHLSIKRWKYVFVLVWEHSRRIYLKSPKACDFDQKMWGHI